MTHELTIDRSHHATLILGDFAALKERLLLLLEKEFGISAEANPDFQIHTYESITIDDARRLKDASSLKPTKGGVKLFLIGLSAIGVEAQNALLKLFEEPAVGTYFFLVAPGNVRLLPTLRSRLFIQDIGQAKKIGREAQAFLTGTGAARLELLKDMVEEKDRAVASALLEELELSLAKDVEEHAAALKELELARGYLSDRASSVKLLLEHLALVLPTV